MRDNQAADDFECTRGVPRLGVDCGILRQAAQVYILKIFKKFEVEYFQGFSWHVTSSKHEGGFYTYTLRMEFSHVDHSELMRQSFDVMSLSVHDVETVKLAKKKLHGLDVEIRNYVSSISKSENQTMRNEDNDVPQHGSTQILDPVRRKSKGVTNSRMKSAIKKRKKGKKRLQPFHGVTPIEQTLMLNTDVHMNPSHQNMEMSCNMMSIQHAYAQPFSFTSLIMQNYQRVPSVPEIMFPSDCPP
ncbi:hypothetical protein AAHA92_05651 [Salvia divinorum]|uniref:Protein FAR1-RELATED SEQUENCE n=1 Tax=Salvia divinorum TaxID=28513 RepID=A0ABD1I6N1_SALDI